MTPSPRSAFAALLLAISIALFASTATSTAHADALGDAWTKWTKRPPDSTQQLSADVRALSHTGAVRLVERATAARGGRLKKQIATLVAVLGVLAIAGWQMQSAMRTREQQRLRLVLDASRHRDGTGR